MDYTIIRKSQRTVTPWAGGTTEQLFIWPEPADYAARIFSFRVSTAVIQLPQSDFTTLPGITRWIMPLSGSMTLEHEGQGNAHLAPCQAHRFEGGWTTRAIGQCIDFNLMLAAGWEGDIAVGEGEYHCHDDGFVGVYAHKEALEIALLSPAAERKTISLCRSDLLVARDGGMLIIEKGQPAAAIFTAHPICPL